MSGHGAATLRRQLAGLAAGLRPERRSFRREYQRCRALEVTWSDTEDNDELGDVAIDFAAELARQRMGNG